MSAATYRDRPAFETRNLKLFYKMSRISHFYTPPCLTKVRFFVNICPFFTSKFKLFVLYSFEYITRSMTLSSTPTQWSQEA
jgi:hypothetical protein